MAALGILTTDCDLVVRTWDDWLETATGLGRDRVVGRPLTEIVPDLEARGLLGRLEDAVTTGTVHVLAPAFHHYLIRCAPQVSSPHFADMQQRVTIGPVRDDTAITGVIVAIEDVTPRLDQERALAAALHSPDAGVRREASDALATVGRIEAAEAFALALRDPNWRVRHAAVEGLAQTHDADFMHSVIESVRKDHRHFALLSSALKLLATTDVELTEPLSALLDDPDPDLRIQAALALGEQHHPNAVAGLVRALGDEHVNVRFQAIESLGRLRAEAALDDLLAIVQSRDFFLAFPALDAIAAIGVSRAGQDLAPLLEDDQFRVPVADALAALGDERTVPPLIDSLNRSNVAAVSIVNAIVRIHDRYDAQYRDGARVSDLVRERVEASGRQHAVAAVAAASAEQLPTVVRLLGWLQGAEVVPALTRLLGDPAARGEVIEALVRHGEGVVDAVLDQLDAADDPTRHAAIVALGRLGSRRATARLVERLDDETLLVPLAGALALIGDPAASNALLPLLGHADGAVRQAAIGALNSIGHPELPARIGALLRDRDPLVRESAVRVAGYFGYAETVDQLFALADDGVEAVRATALEHLGLLDDPRVEPRLRRALEGPSARERAAAVRALARVETPGAGVALVAALDDSDLWVRYYAARAIAEQRYAPAAAALSRLATSDAAPHVRIAALDAIGALSAHSETDTVRALTADPHADVAAAALVALGRIAGADALPDLRDALRAPEPVRQIAAVQALATQGSAAAVGSLEWAALAGANEAVVSAAIGALETVAAGDTAAAGAAVDTLCRMLSDPARRGRATAALAQLPPSRLDELARGLQHPSPEVRCAMVVVLGRVQRAEATALIPAALADADAAVRETVVLTLTRLGTRGLDTTFAALAAQDPSKRVRRAAAAALASSRSCPS